MKPIKFFSVLFAASMLWSCSDDHITNEPNPFDPDLEGKKAYTELNITLAGVDGSRSGTNTPDDGDYGTSTDGTEIGKDDENKVNNVLVILADPDPAKNNRIIAYTAVSTNRIKVDDKDNSISTASAAFELSDIATFYESFDGNQLPEGKDQVNVYVFCNYTSDLYSAVKSSDPNWYNAKCKVVEKSNLDRLAGTDTEESNIAILSTASGLLMNNATVVKKQLPKKLEDWGPYTNESTPFKLSGENGDIDNSGSIRVERSVARFDFKDGSPTNDFTYDISEGANVEGLKIQLIRMCLVNMSKEFYYLRRISDIGHDDASVVLCGTERRNNYIVSPYSDWKLEKFNKAIWDNTKGTFVNLDGSIFNEFGNYYNFCLGNDGDGAIVPWAIDRTARRQWYTQKLSRNPKGGDDATESTSFGDEDNDNPWNSNHTRDGYRIWRYVTENTIPAEVANNHALQQNGISTGLVFKGLMTMPYDKDNDLSAAINGRYYISDGNYVPEGTEGARKFHPMLFVFDGKIYVKFSQMAEFAEKAGKGDILWNAVFGTDETGKSVNDYCNEWVGLSETKGFGNQDPKPGTKEAQALDAFRAACTANGIAIYQYEGRETEDEADGYDDGNGYFCYYYYWNRHNDNGFPGIMGAMEFGVVRNNVYKIAVTNIKRLGHPRKTPNDPDPVKPGTPDETSKIYLTVDIKVLPWTVRVNNVEF